MLDGTREVMIHNWKKFLMSSYCIDNDSSYRHISSQSCPLPRWQAEGPFSCPLLFYDPFISSLTFRHRVSFSLSQWIKG